MIAKVWSGAGRTIGRLPSSVVWLLPANILLFVALSATQQLYLSPTNITTLMSSFAITAVIALSQMVVIAAGGMNLAVGAIGAIAGLASCYLMTAASIPVIPALAGGLAVGAACGALNGWIVSQFGLSPFIVTLATASIFTGITLGLTRSQPIIGLPADFRGIGQGTVLGVPYLLLLSAIAIVAVGLLFRYVGLGRQILAFGGNPVASDLAGVPRWQVHVGVHIISGVLAAWAGWLLLAQIGQGQPDIGSDWLLGSFAGPIIGGTLLAGGYLSVAGTCLAVVLLTQVSSAVVFIGLDPFWVQFLQGAIIVLAALLDRVQFRAVRAGTTVDRTPQPQGVS